MAMGNLKEYFYELSFHVTKLFELEKYFNFEKLQTNSRETTILEKHLFVLRHPHSKFEV